MSGDQWIALAGVSSGAIVGIGSLLFAYFNGKAERAHGERLARSGRLHEQRRAAYVEISRLLERQRLFLVRTEPFLGPKPAPPPPLNDEDWSAVSGQAAVSPSQEVRSLLSEAAKRRSGRRSLSTRSTTTDKRKRGRERHRTRRANPLGRPWTRRATARSSRSRRRRNGCARSSRACSG